MDHFSSQNATTLIPIPAIQIQILANHKLKGQFLNSIFHPTLTSTPTLFLEERQQ